MRFVRKMLALAVLGLAATAASAESYPGKPVTFVVPFAAGGPTDNVARSLAEAMRKPLGQQVIIENVGGAGGTVGTAKVAKAAPDGYTVLLMHAGFSTAPTLYRKLAYDAEKDFEPIGLIVDVPMTMIARSDFQPKDIKEFIPFVKANKDKLSFANAGIGSASHLCGLLFMSAIQSEITTVPYKGTAPAMNDLLGKQVDFMCDQTTNTTAQIQAGKVKVYAVTSKNRLAGFPNVPTMQEGGLAGFEVGIWHGLWVPKGTPKLVVDKLVASLQDGIKDPAFRDRMAKLGADVVPVEQATPAYLGKHVQTEIAKWGAVIKKAGVYAD
jgi:tripartite-type tricarboxylate transporter receptor subunit TctC